MESYIEKVFYPVLFSYLLCIFPTTLMCLYYSFTFLPYYIRKKERIENKFRAHSKSNLLARWHAGTLFFKSISYFFSGKTF